MANSPQDYNPMLQRFVDIYICVNSLVFVLFVATLMIVPVLALNFVSICVISLSKH